MHHTKTNGDLAVFKIQLDLHQKGFYVCIPQTEHAPFDLVAVKNGFAYTIQVKYRTINAKGRVEVPFRKQSDKSPNVYAIYCSDLDQTYYFNPKEFSKCASFRAVKTKNNQSAGVSYLKDYKKFPAIVV